VDTKKDKVNEVLAFINEIHIQDSVGLERVCKLALILQEVWMTLSLEANKYVLHQRKRQQQEDDKTSFCSA
jgi:hypothetical protein